MIKFIIRRIIVSLPLLLGISFMTFLLITVTPGNFFDTLKMDPRVSPDTIAHYEKLYHLDKPLLEQYLVWLKNILKFDLGYSFYYNTPVVDIMKVRLWNTFLLSISSLILTWALAIPLGIIMAVYRNRWIDKILSLGSFLCLSVPSFFFAILFLYAVSVVGGLPLGGMHSVHAQDLSWGQRFVDLLRHLLIPTVVISLGSIAALQRVMRGNLLDALGQQYILAARAKGLPENKVIFKHALRNAINPMITLLGYHFSGLLSGAALVEIICSWPGIGALMLTAVRAKDVYLVMANMMMGGVLLLLGNLLADILLAWADPRIRYEQR
ncbi:MAG TPA: ABC transporter permease [Candidatus Omnitrophota bacterium]|nr:ABC transporter permease [Candidatus Omnitrophota bacterium]HQL40892.1 ABC transporter permease [Candidatus Omnitrophota bacterium]